LALAAVAKAYGVAQQVGKCDLQIKTHFARCRDDAAREVEVLCIEANFDSAQQIVGCQLGADPAQKFSTRL
jgi:hypothetical protein